MKALSLLLTACPSILSGTSNGRINSFPKASQQLWQPTTIFRINHLVLRCNSRAESAKLTITPTTAFVLDSSGARLL
ncbi:hypothetical protein B0T13DRAFT_453712 [Neurospora crassa]|nr:hypothetical protein B0T13DRAFT_453712 [Neurospora crassa]